MYYLTIFFYKILKLKYKTNEVTLVGHKLQGNLEILFNSEVDFKINYITININDYFKIKKKYENNQNRKILSYINPFHVLIMLNSRLIMTSHGIYGHSLLNKLKLIKSIYIGHSLHGAFNPKNVNKFSMYEEVWLYSQYEKKIYREEMKYTGDNLQVIGFLRVDYLISQKNKYYELRKRNQINKKVILIAPTDDRNNKKYKNSEFYIFNRNFLDSMQRISEELNCIFIIKLHINTRNSSINKLKYENIYFQNDLIYDNDYDLLLISDLLITDWSTIFVDYLSLDKPIIFINNPNPNPLITTSIYKFGLNKKVKNYDMLKDEIKSKLISKESNTELLKTNLLGTTYNNRILPNYIKAIKKYFF